MGMQHYKYNGTDVVEMDRGFVRPGDVWDFPDTFFAKDSSGRPTAPFFQKNPELYDKFELYAYDDENGRLVFVNPDDADPAKREHAAAQALLDSLKPTPAPEPQPLPTTAVLTAPVEETAAPTPPASSNKE